MRIEKNHFFHTLVYILVSVFCFSLPDAFAAERITISTLKDLHLTTPLVEKGEARAVIVSPAAGRYRAEVKYVRERIRKLSGVNLPIYDDTNRPMELLKGQHVIVLGNMATSAFIETLYRQWHVILDLKYPGAGGYVLRSLHNPYGTGRNVIFLGGSDDAGVNEAARVFVGGLKGDTAALNVGRLMRIRLGKGLTLPVIGAYLQNWDVQSWSDSRRTTAAGATTGYDPATFFGWNPISIAGALYYMTGQREYLDTFKELAIPNLRKSPTVNRASNAFVDPANPLVKSYHYRAHLLDCVYDLIEESPLFTNDERLFITNKLLDHQYELDPNNTYSRPNADRHGMWHMICIYTGSRYFSYHYPDLVWNKRISNVRQGFASFINNPTWGERDTLEWVATSIEPVFNFFIIDGFDNFVQSGTADIFMQGLTTLMSGEEKDYYNRFLPLNLLFKATNLLKDSRYLWMAKQLRADYNTFRIGQSYWPPLELEARPPKDLVGRVTVAPLARTDHETAKTLVSAQEAFQLLSYRSGLGRRDDFLLLDGFEGLGRHPYQLNTIVRLRMFGGKNILTGYANDLDITRNGMSDSHVARSAALKQKKATKDFAYIHTEVPDMPASIWQRQIVYLKGRWTVVVDRVIAEQAGRFDIIRSWQMGTRIKKIGKPSRRILLANGAGLASADMLFEQISSTIVQGKISRDLGAGDAVEMATLFFNDDGPKAISPVNQGGFLVSGRQAAFIGVGPYRSRALTVSADFAYIGTDRFLLLGGATELKLQDVVVFRSDSPATVLWDLKDESAMVCAANAAHIQLGVAGGTLATVVLPGERVIDSAVPPKDLPSRIAAALSGLEMDLRSTEHAGLKASQRLGDWLAKWEVDLGGNINVLAEVDTPQFYGNDFWAISQAGPTANIARIGADGKLLKKVQQDGELLSVWVAKGEMQSKSFSMLAGFKDDMLRAYSREGKEIWSVKTEIHPDFIIGDRYAAPWFTNPRPPYNMTGVFSIIAGDLWGNGEEEIAIGRPCTVEFYDLHGRLNARVPTRWGNNTSLSLQKNPGSYGKGPILLAGKAYTGNPQLSGINHAYTNISDSLYGGIIPEYANMHAWLQRGTSGLRVTDINGNGNAEIIYTLSGHWNELRVYDNSGKVMWMKYFGPGNSRSIYMSSLETTDLEGDGFKEIIVGTEKGWVHAFDRKGDIIWQRHFASGVTCLSANEKHNMVAVGCEDGMLVLLDAAGKQIAVGDMKSAVKSVIFMADGVIGGNEDGMVACYGIKY
ncbi:hypothetical protein D1BOALGB6SA_9557 [Olavius sp. associated proteobacterium Delta 1]|nr:hypothetical protein D1BOALGB6SA_9557 [Olavius sp. associated proteobacterium Delta 1]